MRSNPSTSVTFATLAQALGVEKRTVERRAEREGWQFTIEQVRGGARRLFNVAMLPEEVRAKLAETVLLSAAGNNNTKPAAFSSTRGTATAVGYVDTSDALPGSTPGPRSQTLPAPQPGSVGELAQWQIEVATARAALIDECSRIALDASITIARAEQLLVARAKEGTLAANLLDLVRIANARRGKGSRVLSVQRLAAWRREAAAAVTPAERLALLAPKGRGKRWRLDPDVAAVLALYRRTPTKPALRWCVAEVVGEKGGGRFNSLYSRVRRELAKLPRPLFYAGRNSGAALKALQPFRRRDFLALAPNDVWVGDGHSAKLRIAHPETGNPFVPEVTVILDVATRYVVGWSVSLSENCLAVSDAMRHAVSRHGLPLVYYSDGGAGQTAKMLDAPITGILGTLGIHHEVGRPGNPQGRGVIERLWRTILIPLAKRFATYQGRGADRETLRKVTLEIDRTLRAARTAEGVTALPRRLPRFQEFVDALEAEILSYNETHAHRSLPKLDGAEHATPAAYRSRRLEGRELDMLPPAELSALFMPAVERTAARGEVKLWHGIYFHRDLMLVDGESVRVHYDIHDASYVLVRRMSGEFIARAELSGNRSGYMPQPFLERLREQRAARRLGLLDRKREEVLAERNAAPIADRAAERPELAEELQALEASFSAEPAPKSIDEMSDSERYALWKALRARLAAGEELEERLAAFYQGYAETAELYLSTERELGSEDTLEPQGRKGAPECRKPNRT